MKKFPLTALLFITAALCLFCAGCSVRILGTSVKLARAEGDVSVLDEKDRELEPAEDMSLYSGYQMSTSRESYSWINLDNTKLAKMDQNSDIQIQKFGKRLEVLVNSGSLFFHVTEPLEADETMNIRTSTMAVGIRGTCGWVESGQQGLMLVHILEGTVECSITDPESGQVWRQAVSGGETAVLEMKNGQGEITVEKFREDEIPPFVTEELEKEECLYQEIKEILGSQNVPGWIPDGDSGEASPSEENDARQNDSDENIQDAGSVPDDNIALGNGFAVVHTGLHEVNCLSGAGGVIVTQQNNLYGAIDYNKNNIVPNAYSVYYMMPNEDGQFILGDSKQAHVFDKSGNIILTVESPCDSWSVHASEGTVVYAHLDENGIPEICCYDIAASAAILEFKLDSRAGREELGPYTTAKITPMENGMFYYSGNEGSLYRAQRSGEMDLAIIQADEMWENTMQDNEIPLYPFRRNWPAYASRDGGLAAYAWGVYLHTFFDFNTMKWYTFGSELPQELAFESESIHYYYSNGKPYGNKGSQMVVSNKSGRCFLLDFSRAQTDAAGYVLNMQEVVLAEYDTITLCSQGFIYAEDGGNQFYLDENGSPVTSFRPRSCSSFYDGYAAVIDNDGLAYIIDSDFNRVSDGYPADSVFQACGLLCIQNGSERIYFSPTH